MNPINPTIETTSARKIDPMQGLGHTDLASAAIMRLNEDGATTAIQLDFGTDSPKERLDHAMATLAEQTGITQLVGFIGPDGKIQSVLVESTKKIGANTAELIASGLYASPDVKHNGRFVTHRFFAGEQLQKLTYRNLVVKRGIAYNVIDLNSGMEARNIEAIVIEGGMEFSLVEQNGTLHRAEINWRDLGMISTVGYKKLDVQPIKAMFVTNGTDGQIVEFVSYQKKAGIYLNGMNGKIVRGTEDITAASFFDDPKDPSKVYVVSTDRRLVEMKINEGGVTVQVHDVLSNDVIEVLPAPVAKDNGHKSLVALVRKDEGLGVSPQIFAAAA